MANIPLEIPAGIVKVDSPNAAKGRYTDGDKIRFIKGKPEKWTGWQKFINETLLGKARGAVSWTNVFGNTNVGIGTNLKLYAIIGNDTLLDITPIRFSGTLSTDPFGTTISSTTVDVFHTAHGANTDDFVTFSGATPVGGITIDGEYQITVVDNDNYTIEHSVAATSTATGGGSSVTFAYQVNTGPESTLVGLGWGAANWGEGTWGTERTEGIQLELRHWSVQEYANDLLASPSGGGLYLWEEDTDSEGEIVPNAPTSMRAMFVTGERYVFALGTSTPMTVAWPDADDITDWTPTPSNTANIRTLQSGSKLMGGVALTDGTNVIWSDTSAYIFQLTGSAFVYDDRLAGTNCGLIGPLAFTKASGTAYWMSGRDFHMFSGGVVDIPNSADIIEFVRRDLDPGHVTKTWCVYDEYNDQVRWGYVSQNSPNGEPDKYIDVSLSDYSWTPGTLNRTTGTIFRPQDASLLMVDETGTIFEHNVGTDDAGAALPAFVTFGLYELTRGENNVDVMGVIPDTQRQTGDLTYNVFAQDRPQSPANIDSQSVVLSETDVIGDLRVEGRLFSMTVTSNVIGGDFRMGIVKLEIQPSGERR